MCSRKHWGTRNRYHILVFHLAVQPEGGKRRKKNFQPLLRPLIRPLSPSPSGQVIQPNAESSRPYTNLHLLSWTESKTSKTACALRGHGHQEGGNNLGNVQPHTADAAPDSGERALMHQSMRVNS